ncbi:MAG: hypothetical protein LJE70_07530 [Chromatiaceae bacterium]|nr:hypothetical protein [Chromatiaceae bacterium]
MLKNMPKKKSSSTVTPIILFYFNNKGDAGRNVWQAGMLFEGNSLIAHASIASIQEVSGRATAAPTITPDHERTSLCSRVHQVSAERSDTGSIRLKRRIRRPDDTRSPFSTISGWLSEPLEVKKTPAKRGRSLVR